MKYTLEQKIAETISYLRTYDRDGTFIENFNKGGEVKIGEGCLDMFLYACKGYAYSLDGRVRIFITYQGKWIISTNYVGDTIFENVKSILEAFNLPESVLHTDVIGTPIGA